VSAVFVGLARATAPIGNYRLRPGDTEVDFFGDWIRQGVCDISDLFNCDNDAADKTIPTDALASADEQGFLEPSLSLSSNCFSVGCLVFRNRDE